MKDNKIIKGVGEVSEETLERYHKIETTLVYSKKRRVKMGYVATLSLSLLLIVSLMLPHLPFNSADAPITVPTDTKVTESTPNNVATSTPAQTIIPAITSSPINTDTVPPESKHGNDTILPETEEPVIPQITDIELNLSPAKQYLINVSEFKNFSDSIFTSADYSKYKSSTIGSGGTTTTDYGVTWTYDKESLNIYPIEEFESLPVYRDKKYSDFDDAPTEPFSIFSARCNYAVEKFEELFSQGKSQSQKFIMNQRTDYRFTYYPNGISSYPTQDDLSNKDLNITISDDMTDEEFINSISAFTEFVFEALGKNYGNYKINRNKHVTNVVFFNESDPVNYSPFTFFNFNDYLGISTDVFYETLKDYIIISFSKSEGNTRTISGIHYYEKTPIKLEGFDVVAYQKIIPLEKAEEILKNGGFWGVGNCPVCGQQKEAVDFSDGYDAVTLKYVYNSGVSHEDVYVLPLYVFYKHLETKEDGEEKYAYVYVPAIEITDLEEYLEKQAENHQHNK